MDLTEHVCSSVVFYSHVSLYSYPSWALLEFLLQIFAGYLHDGSHLFMGVSSGIGLLFVSVVV